MWQSISDLINTYVFAGTALAAGTLKYVLCQELTAIFTVLMIAVPVFVFVKVIKLICDLVT